MSGNRSERRGERLQIMLTPDEIRAVEEWRYEHRMPSRSAAVRALMNLGFHAGTEGAAPQQMLDGRVSSSDIGVLKADPRVEKVLGNTGDGGAILLLGLELMVLHALKSILADAGFATLRPLTSVAEAQRASERERPAAVVIDIDGRTDDLAGFARRMLEREIPVLLCGAQTVRQDLPDGLRAAPLLSRRSAAEALGATLSQMLTEVSLRP